MMLPEHLRELPYILHTNRELGLMLRGVKPLAYFAALVGDEPECLLRYYGHFDRYVAAGRLVRRETADPIRKFEDRLCKHLLYSLPGQEWRMDEMIALVSLPGRWTRERERRFGELLGYEDWQNDHWLTCLPACWNL